MYRFVCLLTVCFTVAGCVREIKLETQFNPAEAEFIKKPGHAIVDGQAFLRRNDGVVVYAAGSDVRLIPATAYADERMNAIYGTRKYVGTIASRSNKFSNNDPQYLAMQKVTKANGEGRFEFDGVAPGRYYIVTNVTWCAPSQYGCLPQGGGLRESVSIKGDEKLTVIMNGQ